MLSYSQRSCPVELKAAKLGEWIAVYVVNKGTEVRHFMMRVLVVEDYDLLEQVIKLLVDRELQDNIRHPSGKLMGGSCRYISEYMSDKLNRPCTAGRDLSTTMKVPIHVTLFETHVVMHEK